MLERIADRVRLGDREEEMSQVAMKLTEIAFFTDHVPQMTDFYRRLLGADPVASSESLAIFLLNGTKIFIHYKYAPKDGELPPENHHASSVQDIDQACEELIQRGMVLEMPPQDYYWGRSAYLRDPDGHLLEITKSEK